MTTSMASSDSAQPLREPLAAEAAAPAVPSARESLGPLVDYFLRLGTIGFGGPVALVGYMHRDLVERRRSVAEETYRLALALAQIMPGPLAAQCAIALGYLQAGLAGATLVGLALVLPSFLMCWPCRGCT
jgi:chromate transporter